MTLPQAEAAIEDLQRAHRELLRVVDSLAEPDWERSVPYGDWTVKDLVAHVIGDMSPSGPGLIHAGILTPEFIADTSKSFDVRVRNASMVEERRRFTTADLRQLLFEAHDAMIEAALKLDESNLPVLAYTVPMGPDYNLLVEDWLWAGHHDRQHAADIERARRLNWQPEQLNFIPEIKEKMRTLVRSQEGALRAVYSVADDAWAEPSPDCPVWTYHDILAHLASNETRRQTRLRSALGEATADELAAINDVDGWNAEAIGKRRNLTVQELVSEFQAGWHSILQVLARFQPQHLSRDVILGAGQTLPAHEFIDRMSSHTSRHASQLLPASRARRFGRARTQ